MHMWHFTVTERLVYFLLDLTMLISRINNQSLNKGVGEYFQGGQKHESQSFLETRASVLMQKLVFKMFARHYLVSHESVQFPSI